MSYVKGIGRSEALLFPETIDQYVHVDNPVRFINAFVDSCDMKAAGFLHSEPPAGRGRPPYNPSDFLKLFIYGYMHKVRSSRNLEKETHRNIEVIWLMRKLTPDHKTIANFRSAHPKALKQIFKEFHRLCKKMDLFGKLLAVDGTIIKASNNITKYKRPKHFKQEIADISEKIDAYMKQLDTQDTQDDSSDASGALEPDLSAKIAELEASKKELESTLESITKDKKGNQATTDPDSRLQSKRGKTVIGYNAQIAVDEKLHLIEVEAVTTAANDATQLQPVCEQIKEGRDDVKGVVIVADQGYTSHRHLANAEAMGFEMHVDQRKQKARNPAFDRDRFTYDAESDEYVCPNGKRLRNSSDRTVKKSLKTTYQNAKECAACSLRKFCTKSAYKKLEISEHLSLVQKVKQRIIDHPEIYEKRKTLVEHRFGTIKRWMNQGEFLCRGLEKVGAEFTLSCLCYNLKRVLKEIPLPVLMKAVKG